MLLLLLSLVFTGCATNTGNPKKDTAARVTNAVLENGARFAGRVALATLQGAVQDGLGGEKIDMTHSAAQALWQQAPSIVTADDVRRIVDAYSGGELKPVAVAAATAFAEVAPQTASTRAVVLDRLARSLSDAAFDSTGLP